MTITGGYRGKDYPVGIGTAFIRRVQSFSAQIADPKTIQYELGNSSPAGVADETNTYTGQIVVNPIDNQSESLFLGVSDITSGAPKGLKDFVDMSAVTLNTPKDSFTGVKVNSLEYAIRTGSDFTLTIGWEGTGAGAGSAVTAIPVSVPGRGSYRAPDIVVKYGGTLTLARAQGARIRATMRTDRLMELSAADAVSIDRDTPNVVASFDFVESDSIAGNGEPSVDAPMDMVIQIGTVSGGKQLTAMQMVFQGKGPAATINGYATRRYDYISKGDATYSGLKIGKIA
jgi:hypothetical protein